MGILKAELKPYFWDIRIWCTVSLQSLPNASYSFSLLVPSPALCSVVTVLASPSHSFVLSVECFSHVLKGHSLWHISMCRLVICIMCEGSSSVLGHDFSWNDYCSSWDRSDLSICKMCTGSKGCSCALFLLMHLWELGPYCFENVICDIWNVWKQVRKSGNSIDSWYNTQMACFFRYIHNVM